MAERPMDIYLNDHMAGAMLGSELSAQLRDRNEGTPLGELMIPIAAEIEEDRETLSDLMDALEVSRNPIKQAGGWVAEKWSRVKFSGAGTGDAEHGNFMAIESLTLGVTGKRCLWVALDAVQSRDEAGHGGPDPADRAGERPTRRARAGPPAGCRRPARRLVGGRGAGPGRSALDQARRGRLEGRDRLGPRGQSHPLHRRAHHLGDQRLRAAQADPRAVADVGHR